MKKLILLTAVLFFYNTIFSQYQLIAKKGDKTKMFLPGTAVKLTYRQTDSTTTFRGRIAAINDNGIVLQHYNKKDTNRLYVPLNDFTEIKKISRSARNISGVLLICSLPIAVALLASNSSEENHNYTSTYTDPFTGEHETSGGTVTIPGTNYTGAAIATVVIAALPYIIVTATEFKASKSKGYTFMIVRK